MEGTCHELSGTRILALMVFPFGMGGSPHTRRALTPSGGGGLSAEATYAKKWRTSGAPIGGNTEPKSGTGSATKIGKGSLTSRELQGG